MSDLLEIAPEKFDYASVALEVASSLQVRASAIGDLVAKTTKSIIAIGRLSKPKLK